MSDEWVLVAGIAATVGVGLLRPPVLVLFAAAFAAAWVHQAVINKRIGGGGEPDEFIFALILNYFFVLTPAIVVLVLTGFL